MSLIPMSLIPMSLTSRRQTIALTLLALSLSIAPVALTVAHAQSPNADEGAAPPRIREASGITYVSGGVGLDDVARMRALAPRFNVRVRFEDRATGASLADVRVVVLNDKSQRLLVLTTEGPLLYLKMPPGRYLLATAYQGNVQERAVTVGRKAQDLSIGFPINDMEDAWRYCAGGSRCRGARDK